MQGLHWKTLEDRGVPAEVMLLLDADGEPIGEVLKQIRRWDTQGMWPVHSPWPHIAPSHPSHLIQFTARHSKYARKFLYTVQYCILSTVVQYISVHHDTSQMCNKMIQNVRSYVVWSPGPVQFRASWSWWATTGASAPRTSLATRRSSIRL